MHEYLKGPARGGGGGGVSLRELSEMLSSELAALDEIVDEADANGVEQLDSLLGSGGGEDAKTLALAEAEETRGLLKWMLANVQVMIGIEAEPPPPTALGAAMAGMRGALRAKAEAQAAEEEAGATALGAATAKMRGALREKSEAEAEAMGGYDDDDEVEAALEAAETSAEQGVPAVLLAVAPLDESPTPADELPLLRPGGEVRLGALQIAAHACVAELEQVAAADAEDFRPNELLRTALDESVRAVKATSEATAAAPREVLMLAESERKELERVAERISAALRERIAAPWRACGLPEGGMTAALQDARTFAEQESAAEVLMAKAAAATSRNSAPFAGGGCGGVVLGTAVIGAEGAQLAALLAALRRHAQRTKSVRLAIGSRELLVRHLRLACARLAPMHARQKHSSKLDAGSSKNGPASWEVVSSIEAEVVSTVALLRQATVRVVEAVVAWRGGLTSQAPFASPLGTPMPESPAMRASASSFASADSLAPPASEHGEEEAVSNYLIHMVTDLDGITELSSEIATVLREAPSRLDRRRLWRTRQVLDLEILTEQRATRTAPSLRWQPVSTSELLKVAGDAVGLLEVAAESDDELLRALGAASVRE